MRVPSTVGDEEDIELRVTYEDEVAGSLVHTINWSDVERRKPSVRELLSVAQTLEMNGELADAKAGYETAVEQYPEDPMVLNAFSWFLLTCEDEGLRQPGRALFVARKAVKLSGEKAPHILDTLAVALHMNGKLEDAVRYSAMAAEQMPQHPDVVQRARDYKAELEGKAATEEQ